MSFKIGTEINGCILAYKNGRILEWIKDSYMSEFNAYIDVFPKSYKKYGIWFDKNNFYNLSTLENNRFFSAAHITHEKYACGKDHSFYNHADDFIEIGDHHMPWRRGGGINSENSNTLNLVKNYIFIENYSFLKKTIDFNEECFYSTPSNIDSKDKSLIIIGGGPSTNTVPWEKLSFDHAWSCNKFYLNKKITDNVNIDMVTIGSHIPHTLKLNGESEIEKYLDNHDCSLSFELEYGDHFSHQEAIRQMMKKYLNRSNLFHTRYRSILGQTTRQVVYAIMLGYKNIYVVGLDGMHYDGTIHSFEEQKKLPSWYMTSHGHAMQNRHFIIYWEYIYELAKKYGCSVYNLGEGRRYNISSNITRYHTPLPPHIKKKLEI